MPLLAAQQVALLCTCHMGSHVQVNLWGLDAIKTKGESVAIVLYLVGARPLREATGRVARYELIPLQARPFGLQAHCCIHKRLSYPLLYSYIRASADVQLCYTGCMDCSCMSLWLVKCFIGLLKCAAGNNSGLWCWCLSPLAPTAAPETQRRCSLVTVIAPPNYTCKRERYLGGRRGGCGVGGSETFTPCIQEHGLQKLACVSVCCTTARYWGLLVQYQLQPA